MPRGTRRRSAIGWLIQVALLLVVTTGSQTHATWAAGPTPGAIALERTALGLWVVTAKLNGRVEGRFLLDTGATWCAVTTRIAARLRLVQVGESVKIQTASDLVPMPLVRIGTVEIGGRRARGVQAVILPTDLEDLDGVIGMNFLNGFVYAIDSQRGLLRLD